VGDHYFWSSETWCLKQDEFPSPSKTNLVSVIVVIIIITRALISRELLMSFNLLKTKDCGGGV
jgi:hypothetical protein